MLVAVAFIFLAAQFTCAAETLPPAPAQYFNDYAHVTRPGTAQRLNGQLAQFERDTSSQILVAIYPKLETGSSLDDYCYRLFHAWGVGQKKINNGAALFVFIADHKTRIQTGYGLEGALPDATCKRILDEEIAPRFRQNDFDGGLTAGVQAMLAAARGEYKGSGRTAQERQNPGGADTGGIGWIPLLFILFIFFIMMRNARRGGIVLGSPGVWMSGGGWGSGGSSWGGGGGSSGGFSGGGGDSGGGGASGSW